MPEKMAFGFQVAGSLFGDIIQAHTRGKGKDIINAISIAIMESQEKGRDINDTCDKVTHIIEQIAEFDRGREDHTDILQMLEVVARAALGAMQEERLVRFRADPRFTGVRRLGTIAALELKVPDPGYLSGIGPKL